MHKSSAIPRTQQESFANTPQESEQFMSVGVQTVHRVEIVVFVVEFAGEMGPIFLWIGIGIWLLTRNCYQWTIYSRVIGEDVYH